MALYEDMFPKGTGAEKMICVAMAVCSALGLQGNITSAVIALATNELQKLYDKIKDELGKE